MSSALGLNAFVSTDTLDGDVIAEASVTGEMGPLLVDGRRGKRRRLPVGWWALSVTVGYLGVVVYLAITTGDLSGFDGRGHPAVTVSHGSEHRKCCIRFHSTDLILHSM